VTVTRTREIPPVTTLLFDLDGTLLDIDMPAFLKAYFSHAGRRFGSPAELPRITPAMAAAGADYRGTLEELATWLDARGPVGSGRQEARI